MHQLSVEQSKCLERKKRKRLLGVLLWTLFSGAVFGLVGQEWELVFVYLDTFVLVLAAISWTHFDAKIKKFRLWRYFAPMMVIFPGPLVVLPIYFVRSRGWVTGIRMCLIGLVFLASQILLGLVATLVVRELRSD